MPYGKVHVCAGITQTVGVLACAPGLTLLPTNPLEGISTQMSVTLGWEVGEEIDIGWTSHMSSSHYIYQSNTYVSAEIWVLWTVVYIDI